jgi:hypothetical protein
MSLIPLNRRTTVFSVLVLAGITFASTPLLVQAAQIAPNPNTGTITVTTPDAYNSLPDFVNNGLINITYVGTDYGALTNNGALTNAGTLSNAMAGTLTNAGTLSNAQTGTFTNAGTLSNTQTGTLTNAGLLTNVYGTLTNDN